MRKVLITLISTLMPIICFAGDATVTWTPPTQNTDGSALTNLAGYQIVYGTSAAALTQAIQVPSPSTTTYTVTNLPTGTWYFAVKAYNSANTYSDISNVASKVVSVAPPAPPTNLHVIDVVVYQVIGTANKFGLIPVGTVPATTSCISDQSVNGYNAVDRNVVTWYGSVKPQVVVALCSG